MRDDRGAAQRLEPQRRPLDRAGDPLRLGEQRDRAPLDDELSASSRRRARAVAGGDERGQRGRAGCVSAATIDVTISRTSPRSRSVSCVSSSSATRKAPPTIGTASRSLRLESATKLTMTSGQFAAAMSAPRLSAAFSPGRVGHPQYIIRRATYPAPPLAAVYPRTTWSRRRLERRSDARPARERDAAVRRRLRGRGARRPRRRGVRALPLRQRRSAPPPRGSSRTSATRSPR